MLACTDGKPGDVSGLVVVVGSEWDAGHPVNGLVGSAEVSDMVVLGRRSLRRLASLGSQRADCAPALRLRFAAELRDDLTRLIVGSPTCTTLAAVAKSAPRGLG